MQSQDVIEIPKMQRSQDLTEVKLYQLEGLPTNLSEAVPNRPTPLFCLLGAHNREERKALAKRFRRFLKAPRELSDEKVVAGACGPQRWRCDVFWHYKNNWWKVAQGPDYHEIFGPSILHSLIAKCDPSAFTYPYTDALEQAFRDAGFDIDGIIENLRKSIKEDFDESRLGFIRVWAKIVDELKAWDVLPPVRRTDIANCVFALASALDQPGFMDQAVMHCLDLAKYFEWLEDDAVLEAAERIAEQQQADDASPPLPLPVDESDREAEDWMALVAQLNTLAVKMAQDGPSQFLVDELHGLAERFDHVPLPSLVTIEGFLQRLRTLFNRFEHGDEAILFLSVIDDLRQILARWEFLARRADASELADLYEDLGQRAEDSAPYEADYIKGAQDLAEAIRACEEAQRQLARASFAKKAELKAELKKTEEVRDRVDDRLTSTVGNLFASLNYRGEAFDAETDWKEKLTTLLQSGTEAAEAATGTEAVLATNVPSMSSEEMTTTAWTEAASSTEPATTVATIPSVASAPAPVAPALDAAVAEIVQTHAPVASASRTASEEPAHAPTPVAIEEVSPPSPVPARFWSLIEAGEYGLAYNLAELAGPTPGIPSANVLRLLVLGVELCYPQGAIARALEEVVAGVEANRDLATLSNADMLAGNLLLVAATIRSGLLAPGTGATEILQQQVSLGAGWDALHKLTTLVTESAQQMHGTILGPDTFRQRAADKTEEGLRQALRQEATAWLDSKSKSKLSFQAATNLWHHWVGKGGRVYELLKPIVESGTSMTSEWQALLASLADPDDVEAQVQDEDRKLRGTRFGDIDYKALDQLQRGVADAVAMVRRWMSIQAAAPRNDFADRTIKALDQGLDALRPLVLAELQKAKLAPAQALRAAAECLGREVAALYSLFDPKVTMVAEERTPLLALNGRLLLLPGVHLDALQMPEGGAQAIREALLAYVPGTTTPRAAAVQKMNEGDFEAAERLLARVRQSDNAGSEDLAQALEGRLAEARAGLRNRHAETQRKVEGAFRSGLVSGSVRDAMTSELTDIESQLKEIRRIDVARARLDKIVAEVGENSKARLSDIRGRLAQLSLPASDPHSIEVTRLLERGDALAAEEYVDHVARGEEPPSSQQADDEPPAFAPFLAAQSQPPNLTEVEVALRAGKDWKEHSFSTMAEPVRQDAAVLVSAWNAIKRAKRPAGEPSFESGNFARLLSGIGFQVDGGDVSLNNRTASRLDVNVKAAPLADRRLCPVPEFGSEAKGLYRVMCIFPKTAELEATEISPATRGTPAATLVLFMGALSREGRQKLLRQNLQARRSWLVIDDIVILYLALQAQGRLRAMFGATLPYTVTDPYRIKPGTVPAEMFYGRVREREAIIGHQAASTVYGGRQLGKTVLLKEIERQLHDPAANNIVQWVDLPGHGVGRSCRPETLWTIVVRELYRFGVVGLDWPDFKPGDGKHVARITEDIRTWLDSHSDGRILLLLDEADEFLREDATEDYPVTRQLKALMERTGGRFKSVFVGLHNVLRSTLAPNNPLVHLGAVEIGPLYAHGESRAAFEMVRGPFAALGYVFADDSLILRILAACNYYPNLINHFCRKLLEKLRSRAEAAVVDPARGPRTISEQTVSEVYESSNLRDDIRHYFLLTLQLDTRYELIANWLAMEYLQKRMASAEGLPALEIRAGARSLWPEGFRAVTEQEFHALLIEMEGLGVLRRTSGNCFTFRNPNVLQLMGTSAEIDERLTQIAVEGELKPGFDATTFRGPLTATTREAPRSPLTVAQEQQVWAQENGVVVVCGAPLSGLSDVATVLGNRPNVSHVVSAAALLVDGALGELDKLRARPKPGINVFIVSDSKPWTLDWIDRFRDNLGPRVSSSSWIRTVFEAGPKLLWNLARENALSRLDEQSLIVLKPWADPYLRVWLEEVSLPPERSLRKKILEATDGRSGLLVQLHSDLDSGPRLQDRIDQFIKGLAEPERAKAILAGLGVASEDVRKGLALMNEMPQETLIEIAHFWPDMGPADIDLASFVRCAELLSLVRLAGADRWEVEPFVAKLLRAAGE